MILKVKLQTGLLVYRPDRKALLKSSGGSGVGNMTLTELVSHNKVS